ncbi:VirB3 family type IV secretion system protein [Acetobacter persici]|uniref:VirB3 family type IV secretion system protein n=1 Tax=Acetobacter persici TaxID=1076596 RepID=UPI001BAC0512|nr:VirB3 family type IV secretion system protein [Acetobacter persici]MBS1017009.1 VirB3 family type IV secretion system protein [Acetobacter persici]
MAERSVPVFKGATRLPTFAGVPRTVILFTAIGCGVMFMFIHAYAIFIFAILYAIEWSITKHDDKMFNILFLSAQTTFPARFSRFWKRWNGSSDSPIVYEKPVAKLKIMERATVMEDVKKAKKGLSSLAGMK